MVNLVLPTFFSPTGVVNTSFPLSDQPVFGEWFIFVEVQGHTYNKSFEVQKYGENLHMHIKLISKIRGHLITLSAVVE